jgi:hypothetical protein
MKLVMAAMVLFAGRDLDGWIPIAGTWEAREQAMVCTAAPGVIRNAFESDAYTLSFEYRAPADGDCRLAVHSRMTTGGVVIPLSTGDASDVWRHLEVRVTPESAIVEMEADDREARTYRAKAGSRGFVRFESMKPGLMIRNVKVGEPGFVPMFDGKTLDGWEIMYPRDPDDPGWVIEDGVVKCRGRRSSWLRTWRTYDNFVLRLEYQLPPRGNSGVFVRAPIHGRVSRNGMEFQLLDDYTFYGEIKPAQHTGSIYDGVAPEVRVPAPARQWNAIEVTCDGKRVRAVLNGIQLYDTTVDDEDKDTNSHLRPLATRRTVGFIGLQDHSSVVRFRHVRLRELPDDESP